MLIADSWLPTIFYLFAATSSMLNGLSAKNAIHYRLPKALQPLNYSLYLHPELETGNFTGQENITIQVLSATNQIILHSNKLIIDSVKVPGKKVVKYELDSVREFLVVDLNTKLSPDENITLSVRFQGRSYNKLVGLYSSSYQTTTGKKRKFATTKFEPTYARQAFPCFDEPQMKATFKISVIYSSKGSYNAISNMNKIESKKLGENTLDSFGTSVPMSTYLACIIVSDFVFLNNTVKANGIGKDFPIRVYATPHHLSKVQFALDFGVAVTEYYIQYYKIAYPLPKLDMAGIPDFASGAMEHWGLVTHRESNLFYDENYSSSWEKQLIVEELAHEITHQWFGNLVTMKWWNDLWLNEGFARFMQDKGVHAVFPDWGMLDQFLIGTLHNVLIYDAKLSSHPIVQKVESPDEITALFDTITYDKAGSILRMLENLVGSTKFEEAVTNYLNKFAFTNTVTDDFLTEVAAVVSDFDVKLLMRTWTEQMGYPVLNVSRSDTGFIITQQRFLSNKDSYAEVAEPSVFNYKWIVPITYILDTFASEEVEDLIYQYDQDSVGIAVNSDVKWIKLNVRQLGYYRVNYETSIWDSIIKQLIDKPTRFDIADRAHLLNDAFALADSNQLAYSIPLEMTSYLAQEKDFVPWYVASYNLQSLRRNLMYTDIYVSLRSYFRTLLSNVYAEFGWTERSAHHLKKRLSVSITSAACAFEHPDCLRQASQRFSRWLQNPTAANRPDPDYRTLVYYYGIQQTHTDSQWSKLLEIYMAETDPSEKLKIMYGLTGVRIPKILHRMVTLATNESIVKRQDYFKCLETIAANPVGVPIVWDYYRDKWPELVERFGLNDRTLGKLIVGITASFASQVKLEEVQHFYKKYPEAGAGTSPRLQAIDTIKYNINWLKDNRASIANWLNEKS